MGKIGGAGSLDQLITIQLKTETNDLGSIEENWTDQLEDVPCAVEWLGSREFPAAEKRHAESTVRFRIRYRHGIEADRNRILYVLDPNTSPSDVRTFDIFPPMMIGRREGLHIEARETI